MNKSITYHEPTLNNTLCKKYYFTFKALGDLAQIKDKNKFLFIAENEYYGAIAVDCVGYIYQQNLRTALAEFIKITTNLKIVAFSLNFIKAN